MNSAQVTLYPLELSLHHVKKSWGGWPGKIGEIRSLSGPPQESLVLNGPLAGQRLTEIVGDFQQRLLGMEMELDPREPFPLLLKFIATMKNTSIHVHPDDAYTMENGLSMVGKNKIWFILSARPGGLIYLGFKDKINEKQVREAIHKESLHNLLNAISVKQGDLYTVPAGRIHAIGKGIKLFEIQNHSDLYFKLFEWDRKTPQGDEETSHLDKAFNILDFDPIIPKPIPRIAIHSEKNRIEYISLTPHFTVRRLIIKDSLEISFNGDRFVVYTGLSGSGWLRWGLSDICTYIQAYQSVLVPAIPEDLYFESDERFEVLETSVPDMAGETLDQMIRLGLPLERIAALGGDDYGSILKEYLR